MFQPNRALLTLAALLIPAAAQADRSEHAELKTFVQARIAGTLGATGRAVQGYEAVLGSSPASEIIAIHALRQAMVAGDRALAVKAAQVLDRSRSASPDARFLLLAEAVRMNDWPAARRHIKALEQDDMFSAMVPVAAAWVSFGSGEGDPLMLLEAGASELLSASYVAEHRPLLLLALGREKEGLVALRNRLEAQDSRGERLLIAAAALLAKEGRQAKVFALLPADDPRIAAVRSAMAGRKKVDGAIASAQAGLAEYFLRFAIDFQRQDILSSLATSFARLTTFLEPDNSEAWLVTSELLAADGQQREALAALAKIPRKDPAVGRMLDARVRLLAATGDKQAALDQAKAAAKARKAGAADWTRLGDLYGELDLHRESADAYGRALGVYGHAPGGRPEWALWLLRGGALDQAGSWTEAKAALVKAHQLAPDEALVLNYLGYAQLERRENMVEAEKLISAAVRLQPESPQITDSLGWARYLQGDVPQAIELLERAVRGEPNDAAINEHLGDAYYSAGRRYEARYAWTAALFSAEGEDAARLQAKIERGLNPELASP